MRLGFPSDNKARQFGGLRIDPEIPVIQLDCGSDEGLFEQIGTRSGRASLDDEELCLQTFAVPAHKIQANHKKTAIIIPCKNEDPKRLWIVLGGLPNECLPVLVSNSSRGPDHDRYKDELDLMRRFSRNAGNRPILAIHQKDEGSAEAFLAAGMSGLIGSDHRIRNGKGEGMLLGMAVVALYCPERQYIGFVDADCAVSGASREYCDVFASGFAMCHQDKYLMIRIRWGSKPKVVKNQLEFNHEGRSSKIVNEWFNVLLNYMQPQTHSSKTTNKVMVTGNAGEHAMTMDLARTSRVAGGYAVEPFEIMDLFARTGEEQWPIPAIPRGNGVNGHANGANGTHANGVNGVNGHSHRHGHHASPIRSARILQIRTQNPHIHRSTDDQHVHSMALEGLGSIYHCLPAPTTGTGPRAWVSQLRGKMLDFVHKNGPERTTQVPRIYQSLESLDAVRFGQVMTQRAHLEVIGAYRVKPVRDFNDRTS